MTIKRLISQLPGVKSKNVLVRIISIASYNLAAMAILSWIATSPSSDPSETSVLGETNQTYLVTKIVDGDTIKIDTGQTIRYIGIDTPETVSPRKPVQCFGKEATDKNRELVEGRRITLEKDVSETDRYGRLLRYVYVDGQMVNKILVSQGYAQASTYPPDLAHQTEFAELQKSAREKQLGLWGAGCEIMTE